MSTPSSIQLLRRTGRKRRREVDSALRTQAASTIATAVEARLVGVRALGMYLADDGEVDLGEAIGACWRHGVTVAVPRVAGSGMTFARLPESAALIRNRFGIAEPTPPNGRADGADDDLVPLASLTFVLAPLVAFDSDGNRLGRGGGYYDRCFAVPDAPPLVGVAFECQRVERVPVAAHDIALAAIVTEDGWQDFARDRP